METVMLRQQAAAAVAFMAAPEAAASPSRRLGFVRCPVANRVRRSSRTRFALRRAAVRAVSALSPSPSPAPEKKLELAGAGAVPLFVGLPVNTVAGGGEVTHVKAIAAGLRALKLMGVDGVELPVFWAVAQPDSPELFNWKGYLAVARMAHAAGLRVRASLRFDGPPLPAWVAAAADVDADVLFADRSGKRCEECLSFAADEVPVLAGGRLSPLTAYKVFFAGFRDAFADLLGTTITDVVVGLGPGGRLGYPSNPSSSGAGEFQCYDKYMLASLRQHAVDAGQPMWGLSGPHDAPKYDDSPELSGFFKDYGGAWESPYGEFFLSWYSGELLAHGDRVLSAAADAFRGLPVSLSAKIPLVHHWHGMRSRPAALTAGYCGYAAASDMFAKHDCAVIIPGMELSGGEALLREIRGALRSSGVRVAGENAALVTPGTSGSFGKIVQNLAGDDGEGVGWFTYQRMGAELFSPEHWPLFTAFVRSIGQQAEVEADDLPEDGDGALTVPSSATVAAAVDAPAPAASSLQLV